VRTLALLELILRRRPRGAKGVWTGIAFAAFLLRQHHKRIASGRVVRREALLPGESILITHSTQPEG
jgi:hypothetical protein